MVEEDEVVVLESVGGVDEDIRELNENLTINLLDVENVHL
jgi:ATP-dependent 26S proteasome regulatory subunit